mgnify:FL=1
MAYTFGSCAWIASGVYNARTKSDPSFAVMNVALLLIFVYGAWSEYKTIVKEYGK